MQLPYFKICGQLGYEPDTFSCTIKEKDGQNPLGFGIMGVVGLSMLIITFCYLRIYFKVRNHAHTVHSTIDNLTRDESTRQSFRLHTNAMEKKVTKTMVLVWIGFVMCFLPTTLIMSLHPMPPNRDLPALHIAGYIIFWCSAFINPIIYFVSNEGFRKRVLVIVKCSNSSGDNVSIILGPASSRHANA